MVVIRSVQVVNLWMVYTTDSSSRNFWYILEKRGIADAGNRDCQAISQWTQSSRAIASRVPFRGQSGSRAPVGGGRAFGAAHRRYGRLVCGTRSRSRGILLQQKQRA